MARYAGVNGSVFGWAAAAMTLAAIPPTFAATPAVQWGGDYVSATLPYAGHVPANATASDLYGDPHGPFVIDVDGDGPDDSIAGRALSLTTPFSPAGGYVGTSDTFYGGGSVTRTNALVNDGYSEISVLNQGPNDSIHFHVDTGGDVHTLHFLQYWNKPDFRNGLGAASNLTLDDGGFSLSTSQAAGHHTDELLRWVVRDGSQFYVSQAVTTLSNNAAYAVPYATLTSWAPYNPGDGGATPGAAALLSLDFDEAGPFAPHTFTDVTALGFYIEHEAATGPIHTHIEGFGATAVPEPVTGATLIALSGAAASLCTRRRLVR